MGRTITEGRQSRELPSVTANSTLAESGHRFISRPGLGLAVADLLLAALAAGQADTDTSLCLSNHGLVHVLLLQSLVFGALLVTLHLLVGHAHEAIGLDDARLDLTAQLGVGLALEVLVEGTHALTVLGTTLGLVDVVCGELDGTGDGQNVLRG